MSGTARRTTTASWFPSAADRCRTLGPPAARPPPGRAAKSGQARDQQVAAILGGCGAPVFATCPWREGLDRTPHPAGKAPLQGETPLFGCAPVRSQSRRFETGTTPANSLSSGIKSRIVGHLSVILALRASRIPALRLLGVGPENSPSTVDTLECRRILPSMQLSQTAATAMFF